MSFVVIVPTRNVSNMAQCCAAIRKSGEDCQIVIVWDGDYLGSEPHPLSEEWHPQFSAPYLITMAAQPFIFARSINHGVEKAKHIRPDMGAVFLWNDDALLIRRGDRPLTAMARSVQYSTEVDGNSWGVVSCAIQGHAGPAFPMSDNRLAELYAGVDPSLWPVRPSANPKMVPFTAVYIPRRALDIVGPLDERFAGVADGEEVYGGEDDDWCFRARSKGFRIGVYDGALVDHATLPSTFRPDGKGRSTAGAKARFREIHGFQMGTR